jgi:threonine dehydrogenase-like Zn-dependent dehydrogenase
MEPLAVGVHSCKRANVRFGDVVLVMGAGPIGLVTMMAAKAMAATAVFITGTNQTYSERPPHGFYCRSGRLSFEKS